MGGFGWRAGACRVGKCLIAGLAMLAVVPPVSAQTIQYEFLTPADTEDDRLWRVDTLSGEVGMCTFEKKDRKHPRGFMACLKAGAGASIQDQPGPYGLVRSNREDATSVFRVNRRTGTMSLCYERDDRKGHRIVCTEQNR